MEKASTDGSTLTRVQVANLLGISRRRVHQLQAEGKLTSIKDPHGVHRFSRHAVLAYAKTRGRPRRDKAYGQVAAEVFRLFREGVELPEVVMQTKQTPQTIRALWDEYRRPLESPAAPEPDTREYDESVRAFFAGREPRGLNGANR